MPKVTQLHRSEVDDVLDEVREAGLEEIMVFGKSKDGQYMTFDNNSITLETTAIGTALFQAELAKGTGRLLGPESFDGIDE